jgi:hypothetical protein
MCYLYKRSKFVENKHALYGVRVIQYVYVIYTSKGTSKKFGVHVIHRCALSTGKYGIYINFYMSRVIFGLFPGVWCLIADVSEHRVCSIFIGEWIWSV